MVLTWLPSCHWLPHLSLLGTHKELLSPQVDIMRLSEPLRILIYLSCKKKDKDLLHTYQPYRSHILTYTLFLLLVLLPDKKRKISPCDTDVHFNFIQIGCICICVCVHVYFNLMTDFKIFR